MAQLQIVQNVNRSMECSECGAAGIAACDCGAPYMPASVRAAKAIAANPGKSARALSVETGISEATLRRASTASNDAVGVTTLQGLVGPDGVTRRQGLDGKWRRMPQRKTKPEEIMPTQEEADESYQNTLYDHACQIVDTEMSGETRQRFFAHLRRKYDVKYTQSDAQRRDKGLPA